MINYYARRKLNYRMCVKITRTFVNLYIILYYILVIPTKSQSSSHEMVRTIDTASDSPIVFHAADTSCNRSSDAQISLYNLVPITDFYASHTHCTLNCIYARRIVIYSTTISYDVSRTFEQYTVFN